MAVSLQAYGIMVALFSVVLFFSCLFHCLLMRAHWFRTPEGTTYSYNQWPFWSEGTSDGQTSTPEIKDQSGDAYLEGVSVMMPGQDVPTHVACPSPLKTTEGDGSENAHIVQMSEVAREER